MKNLYNTMLKWSPASQEEVEFQVSLCLIADGTGISGERLSSFIDQITAYRARMAHLESELAKCRERVKCLESS